MLPIIFVLPHMFFSLAGSGLRIHTNMLLGVEGNPNRAQLNPHYLQELIAGNFLIKNEQITQLENIGQGIVMWKKSYRLYTMW